MKSENVCGIEGVDTRALTKLIREKGSMLGRIVMEGHDPETNQMMDPNTMNLVNEVSVPSVRTYNASGTPRICAIDCGLKQNQLRCLIKRGTVTTKILQRYWCKVNRY